MSWNAFEERHKRWNLLVILKWAVYEALHTRDTSNQHQREFQFYRRRTQLLWNATTERHKRFNSLVNLQWAVYEALHTRDTSNQHQRESQFYTETSIVDDFLPF